MTRRTSQETTYREMAINVDGLLMLLGGEYGISNNPHHLARTALGVNPYGWTKTIYSDEAFEMWYRLHKLNPEDVDSLHHLAIMHHAKAIDLENGAEPSKSEGDWEKGAEFWCRLCQKEEFWRRFGPEIENERKRDETIEKLKTEWMKQLVQLHFEIAFDPDIKKRQRISYHISLALRIPFPEEVKEEVRKDIYEKWIKQVDSRVWNHELLDEEMLEGAMTIITGYLDRDPEYIPALSDLLRLQARICAAWVMEIHALEEDDEVRDELIEKIYMASNRWEAHFNRLRKIAGELEPDLKAKLCYWFNIIAQAHVVMKEYSKAGVLFLNAVEASIGEEDEIKYLKERAGEAAALDAREQAVDTHPSNRPHVIALLDDIRDNSVLSLGTYFVLANAYYLIQDFDTAQVLCEKGLALEPEDYDLNKIEAMERTKELIRELLDRIA